MASTGLHVKSVTLRVTVEERSAIRAAAEALDVSVSGLFVLAGKNAAHRLGVYEASGAPPPPLTGPWKDLPDRGGEITTDRFSATFLQIEIDLFRRAAQWVGTTPGLFVIGATLRFVANMQTCGGRKRVIASVVLPTQYRRLRAGS